jgi:hypothetical protein
MVYWRRRVPALMVASAALLLPPLRAQDKPAPRPTVETAGPAE